MSILSFLKKDDVSLNINIGNGGIDVSIVSFVPGRLPKFIYSISAPYTGERPDASKLSGSMSKLLDSLLKTTMKKGWFRHSWTGGVRKFSHIVVVFSSPWLRIKNRSISLSQDLPFVITKEFIDDIVEKEEILFRKELEKESQENTGGDFVVVEKSIVHTKINGYAVDEVVGRRTKDLEAYLYVSAISRDIEKKISEIVLHHTHVPSREIIMNSFPLVLFSAVRDNFSGGDDFMIMNINSEITDIIQTSGHVIKSIESFPFGRNSIIRQISKSFKVSMEIAESQLAMFVANKLDDSMHISIQNILIDLEREWSIYFENALSTLSPEMIHPKKLFIMTNNDISSIFIDFLAVPKADSTINYRKNLEVVHINKSELAHYYENQSKEAINESLVVIAMFINKLKLG